MNNSDKKVVPVRYLGQQHVLEDLGRIPTLQDWLVNLKLVSWMHGRKLDIEAENEESRSLQASIDPARETRAVEEK